MATGSPMLLGKDNVADHVTYVALLGGDHPEKTFVFRAQAGNRNSHGIRGEGTGTGWGVYGVSIASGTGVRGYSASAQGVHGITDGQSLTTAAGVLGEATKMGGTAVRAKAKSGIAVHATSDEWGVIGRGGAAGVEGATTKKGGIAVWGHTYGVQGAWAAQFDGPVVINGALTVTGSPKSAAVRFPDGTLRRLYSMESPESWFEDFGEARLVRGRAEVKLRPDFVALVRGAYQVFLTPCGESNGLYVATRRPRAFAVREQGRGTSSLAFSYRIVARRRDIEGPRLEVVTLPPPPPSRPGLPDEPGRGRRPQRTRS